MCYMIIIYQNIFKSFKLCFTISLSDVVSCMCDNTSTFIALDRSFQMKSISLFWTSFERRESQTYPHKLNATQGNIWYHFYNVFGMTWSGIEPTTSRLRGERSNLWTTAAGCIWVDNAKWDTSANAIVFQSLYTPYI